MAEGGLFVGWWVELSMIKRITALLILLSIGMSQKEFVENAIATAINNTQYEVQYA